MKHGGGQRDQAGIDPTRRRKDSGSTQPDCAPVTHEYMKINNVHMLYDNNSINVNVDRDERQ